jgi:hypothetical protein
VARRCDFGRRFSTLGVVSGFGVGVEASGRAGGVFGKSGKYAIYSMIWTFCTWSSPDVDGMCMIYFVEKGYQFSKATTTCTCMLYMITKTNANASS